MAQLERTLGVPEATPEKILAAISGVSTATVSSPRVLEPGMTVRLELLGERNGGKVPLYGRLFSQWLHFAFPRECPYPQLSGSTNPLSPEEYMKAKSEKPTMKIQDVHGYIEGAAAQAAQDLSRVHIAYAQGVSVQEEEDTLMSTWSDEEEIFFVPEEAPPSLVGAFLRGAVRLVVVGGIVFAAGDAARRFGGMKNCELGKAKKEHLV